MPPEQGERWWRQPPKGGISEKGSTTIAAFNFPAFPYPAKNQTTGLTPEGNAPLLPTAPPPVGEVYPSLIVVLT